MVVHWLGSGRCCWYDYVAFHRISDPVNSTESLDSHDRSVDCPICIRWSQCMDQKMCSATVKDRRPWQNYHSISNFPVFSVSMWTLSCVQLAIVCVHDLAWVNHWFRCHSIRCLWRCALNAIARIAVDVLHRLRVQRNCNNLRLAPSVLTIWWLRHSAMRRRSMFPDCYKTYSGRLYRNFDTRSYCCRAAVPRHHCADWLNSLGSLCFDFPHSAMDFFAA